MACRGVMKWRRKQCFSRLRFATPCQVWKGVFMKRTCGAWSESWRLHVFLPKFGAKKMVGVISLIWKTLLRSNGCTLIKNCHSFVKKRKYICFCSFMQQRKNLAQLKRPPFRNNYKMPQKIVAPLTFIFFIVPGSCHQRLVCYRNYFEKLLFNHWKKINYNVIVCIE